jgi:FkbM family methyltransferase
MLFVSKLRKIMPAPLRRRFGQLRAVQHRLFIWSQVATRITGSDPSSRRLLRAALLRAPISVWRDLDEYQMPMLSETCRVISRGIGTFHIRPFTDDLYAVIPRRELQVERYIRKSLKPGDIFVDAGSNIGYYTILASRLVGGSGKVIACEMMPETARSLRKNILDNKCFNVEVNEGALYSDEGRVVVVSFAAHKPGSASIVRTDRTTRVEVATKRLEYILKNVSRVACMKMDLEGAELGALEGLGSALNKIDRIVFENQSDPLPVSWLKDHGFNVEMIDPTNAVAERSQSLG